VYQTIATIDYNNQIEFENELGSHAIKFELLDFASGGNPHYSISIKTREQHLALVEILWKR
jgi:hypothetical protein